MNLTKASSAESRYSPKPFFGFTLNQNKHQLALYVIIVLLLMVLPCFLDISDKYDYSYFDTQTMKEFAEETVQVVGACGAIASWLIAVFAGMNSLSYVNSKKAIGCYHSLPVRRESIFLSETAVRSLYYLIAAALGYSVTYFMMLGANKYTIEYTGYFLGFVLCSLIVFMYSYSLTLVAAGLCGTSFMRFAMTAILAFFPLIFYSLIVGTAAMNPSYSVIDTSYYLDYNVLMWIFSPIRVLFGLVEVAGNKSFVFILSIIPNAVVYYFSALLLHKHRRSENAETTVVWKPVFVIVKYSLIIASALLGMIFFGEIFDSIFLGLIFGLVVAFMVVNSIMYRSSRMMFKGVKPFIVLSVLMLLYMFFVPLNATGFIGKPYPEWNTKSISFEINGTRVTYDDDEIISQFCESLDKGTFTYMEFSGIALQYADDPVQYMFPDQLYYSDMIKYSSDEQYIPVMDNEQRITVVQVPKFGIPLAGKFNIDMNGEFWDTLWHTEEFLDSYNYNKVMKDSQVMSINMEIAGKRFYVYNKNYTDYKDGINGLHGAKITDEFLSSLVLRAEYRDNSPLVGHMTLNCYNDNGDSDGQFDYPIYADDLAVLKAACKIANTKSYLENNEYVFPYNIDSIDEYYEYISENCYTAALVDIKTGHAKLLETDDLASLAPYTTTFPYCSGYYRSYSDNKNGSFSKTSDSGYIILCNVDGNVHEIRFRRDAITDTELNRFFANLDK